MPLSFPITARRPAARLRAWPVLTAYLAAFFLSLIGGALVVFGVAWARASASPARIAEEATRFALSTWGLITVALVNAAILAFVAWTTVRLERLSPVPALRLGMGATSLSGLLAVVVGMFGLSASLGTAADLLGIRGGSMIDTVAAALDAPSAAARVMAIAALGVAPGIAEEVFFRGLMQSRLAACWGRWPGIIATSIAFGLIHLDPVQGSLAAGAGLFLGWAAERFDSIRVTMVAHATNNVVFVLLASTTWTHPTSVGSRRIGCALGALVCLAAVVFVERQRRGLRALTERL